MSLTFLIFFYSALLCLIFIIGRRLLFPLHTTDSSKMTIFDVPVIAQGVRNFVIWIPMILRMTLITIVSGISLSIHNFGKALERYRRRHEHTHSFE